MCFFTVRAYGVTTHLKPVLKEEEEKREYSRHKLERENWQREGFSSKRRLLEVLVPVHVCTVHLSVSEYEWYEIREIFGTDLLLYLNTVRIVRHLRVILVCCSRRHYCCGLACAGPWEHLGGVFWYAIVRNIGRFMVRCASIWEILGKSSTRITKYYEL